MKVLSISSDRLLFEKGSPVADRMIEYAKKIGELHIVVFSLAWSNLKPVSLGQNVWVYPTSSVNKLWYVFDAYRIGIRIAREHLFEKGRSLITTQDPFESGLAGMLLKKKLEIPFQVQLHTDIGSPYFNRGFNRVRIFIAQRTLKKADTVRVVSSSIAEKIVDMFDISPSKISVLPVMVDKEKIMHSPVSTNLKSKYHQCDVIILMVGRLEPEKNYLFALNVFSEVYKKNPKAGLVIVGSGGQEGKLKARVQELGIGQNVFFDGTVSDLFSYYKTADIFLHTSIFEGYGLVFVETALSGCPIVSSRVGIAQEFEKTEALVCAVNDASCFESSLLELMTHREKGRELALNAKNKMEGRILSKEEFLQQHQKLWENTASS